MNNEFDEIVVGKSNGDFMSQMEEEYNRIKQQEMEEEKNPLEERIKSKNWKTRKNAYQQILDLLKEEKCFQRFEKISIHILDDPHPNAQETSLEIVKYFIENHENISHLIPDIFKAILEKCYTSTKSNLKQKSREIIVLSLEVSMDSKAHCEIIKEGIENKNGKIQQASLNIFSYLISLFGAYKIEYRTILSTIEKTSDHLCSTPQIRAEVIELYKELFKWIRESIKNYITKLKDNMQKDLEKVIEDVKSNPKFVSPQPTKFLKCDKDKINSQLDKHDEIKSKMLLIQEEAKIFQNTEAVELFQGKYNQDWVEDIMAKERKWIEKKEMLEKFISDSNVFKINNSSKGHLVACFLKLLKDNNINVVNCTIIAINNMAKGLRKDFIEAKEFLVPLIEKLKEKREKIVTDVFTCLDSIMTHCLPIDEVIDDLREYITSDKSDKTTQIKERFCVFVEKTVLKTFITVLRKVAKGLADIMFIMSEDSSPDVRNAALKTIGIIKFRVGDMLISKVLNEICDLKKKKVDEAAKNVIVDPVYDKDDKAGVSANIKKPGGALNVKNSSMQVDIKTTQQPNQIKNYSTGDVEMTDMTNTNNTGFVVMVKSPPNNVNNMVNITDNNDVEMATDNIVIPNKAVKPPMQRSLSTNNIKTNNPAKTQAKANPSNAGASNNNTNNIDADIEIEEDNNMNNEEVEVYVKDKIGCDICNMFNDSKWENRKTAFASLSNYISSNPDEANKFIDILLRFIKIKLKDYKENNFNINKEAINVVLNLCELCNNFQKKHCVILIKKFSEKIGDNKLKQNILNMFFKFMEYHGPKYITNILIKHITNNVKSPNVLKEFSAFLEKAIEDFGVAILPIKEIVEFGKNLASNANPQLRNSATSLFCEIYKYIGANIKKFLKDLKEATLKVIETEFEKITVVNTNTSEIKRELKGNAYLELQQSSTTGNVLDTLFPKIDISKKINGKIIKDLNEGKWQVKKEALETLEKIFQDANMKIYPNGLNEVVASLKNKLDDGNKNMVRIMIQFITKMVEALGKDCKIFAKPLINPIMKNLSDKMNLLREDVIKCLEKWSEMIGFEGVLLYCPTYLLIDNFELRTDLLKLILKYKTALIKYDTKELVPGVLSCLLDKTPSVRNLAEELAKEMLKIININNFYVAMKDYKPAIANTIKTIIEKYSSLICVEPTTENIIDREMNSLNINNANQVGFKIPNEVNTGINGNTTNHHRSVSVNNMNNLKQINTGNNQNNSNKPNNITANQNNKVISNKNKRDSNSSRESLNNSKEKEKKNKQQSINSMNTLKTNNNSSTNNLKNSTNTMNIKPIDVDSIIQENSLKIVSSTSLPLLINANIKFNQKIKRIENEKKFLFPNQFITAEYDSALKMTMLNFFNKNHIDSLYSNEVTKINSFLSLVNSTMKSDPILFYEVTDVILKWILIRNIEMNNNLFFNNAIFEFFKNLLHFLNDNECSLLELENKFMIEILVSKIFTINPNNKIKSKQFFMEYCSSKIFKHEIILEMLISKINSIYDLDMKNELFDLLANISHIYNYILEDFHKMKLLVSLFEAVIEENLKQKVYHLIKNIYEKFIQDHKEDQNLLNGIDDIIKSNRETIKLLPKQILLQDTNHDFTNTHINHNNKNNSNPSNFINSYENSHYETNSLFSKSPILSVIKNREDKENSSKEPLYPKLIDTFDQNKMNMILDSMTASDISNDEKIKHLLELSDIFTNKLNECVIILEKNIDMVLKSFRDLLRQIFTNKGNLNTNNNIELLKYLLTVYYKLALAKDIIENCEIATVYSTYEEILRAILYEGLETIGEQDEGKKIIKSLNALVLKFMENFNTTLTFVSLIKLIQFYCGDNSRICSLSIKCLLKLSNIMPSIINNIDIEKIIIAISEFTIEFEKTHPDLNPTSQNEEMCLKILRTIIHEIIKIKNEGIWNFYKTAIERHSMPDKYVKRWIQLIMRSKNGLSMPSSNIVNNMSSYSNVISSSPMVMNKKIGVGMGSNILNYSSNENPHLACSGFNMQNYGNINSNNSNNVLHNIIDWENELNFYLEKLKKETKNLNSNSLPNQTSANDIEKLHCEIIAIVKRNNVSIEYLKDKMNETEYNNFCVIFNTVTNNDNSNFNSYSQKIQSSATAINLFNNLIDHNSNFNQTGQKVSDFNINPVNDKEGKENLNSNINTNLNNVVIDNNSNNNPENKNKLTTSVNNSLNNISNFNNSNTINNSQNLQIKTLQEYRNKLHGISDRSANKSNVLFNNANSPSPIKPTSNNIDDVNIDRKQQYMDNFYKNKEMLRNNNKRDFSSEMRTNMTSSNSNDSSGSQFFDKLAEMKKRLQLLRSQKY